MSRDAQMEAGIADEQRHHDRNNDGNRDAKPRRQAHIIPQENAAIAADSGESAVAERGEAETAHDRPAGINERPNENLDQQVKIVPFRAAEEKADDERQRN